MGTCEDGEEVYKMQVFMTKVGKQPGELVSESKTR